MFCAKAPAPEAKLQKPPINAAVLTRLQRSIASEAGIEKITMPINNAELSRPACASLICHSTLISGSNAATIMRSAKSRIIIRKKSENTRIVVRLPNRYSPWEVTTSTDPAWLESVMRSSL